MNKNLINSYYNKNKGDYWDDIFFIGLFIGANISLFLHVCALLGKDEYENIKTIEIKKENKD